MDRPLPFYNWSLKKALDTEPDTFIKARIRIIFTILLFSLLKAVITIVVATGANQGMQNKRAVVALLLYIGLTKLLLGMPRYNKAIAHIMLCAGVALVWSNMFFYVHKLNLATLQFVFMIVLCGFYTIGGRGGLIYSFISVIPVMFAIIGGDKVDLYPAYVPQELAAPGQEIITVLNFITIITAHYLFYRAFQANVAEKERLNEQLRYAVSEANHLAESRSNFLSTMSHELRTPLNAVIGTAELLIKDKPEERQKDNLKILHSSALDLLSLINNVLDFNKIDSDKLELEKLPVNLAELVQSLCAALKIRANSKGLKLALEIDEQLKSIYVSTDPTRLSQILYNLVGNAIKFTDRGSVSIGLSCADMVEDGITVLFTVTDTGVGISTDKHEAIFDVFAQAESHVTRKYGGTGLGLPIVKELLQLFDSHIELESVPGKGSSFSFSLLLQTAPSPEVGDSADESFEEQIENYSHLRILVAEDNEVNRLIIKKQLAIFNVTPVIVSNGAMAYDAWASSPFDAVMLDLHMPVADGYETVRRIRANAYIHTAQTHIIAFTASINERDQLFSAGFDDFLYKPVNIKDLREKLDDIAGRSGRVY